MPQYRFSGAAYVLFALLGIGALLIATAIVLRLDQPDIADTRAIASYSRNKALASTSTKDHTTKQEPSQATSRSQEAITTPDASSTETQTPASVTRTSVSIATPDTAGNSQNLSAPGRSFARFARPANKRAARKPGKHHARAAKVIGTSLRKLPTWNTRIGAPIFYRPSVVKHPAFSANRAKGVGASAKPVCRTLQQTSGNSRVVFPLPDEYLYSYEDTWGDARVQGAHEGTDLMAPEGTPEYAITDGTLVPVAGANGDGWNTLGGYTVMLRADYDMGPIRAEDLFYYAHMREESALPIGTHVRAGQVLGYVGDTGEGPEVTRGLFPPHLHLGWYDTTGLRTNLPSGAMNPYPLLQWLKSNGGLISGGSSVRYCEAPQGEEPIPSTGARVWPSSSSPGKMPDLATGTNNAKPSPVVDHTFHVSGRVSERPESIQRRITHKPVKRRVVENTRPVRTRARIPAPASHGVNVSRHDAVTKRSHRAASGVSGRLSRRHHEVRVILHKVEERVRSLYPGHIRDGLRNRIGGWLQPYRPAKPHEGVTSHDDSKLEERYHHGKDRAGKDETTKPEQAANRGNNDGVSAEETACTVANAEDCSGTDGDSMPPSEPHERNTVENAPVTTSGDTESETLPASDDAEQTEDVTSTNSKVVETSESTSANPIPEDSGTSESTVLEPEAEPAGE